jgi:hypothetical protein
MEYAIYVDKAPSGQHEQDSSTANLVLLQEVRRSILEGVAADLRDICGQAHVGSTNGASDEAARDRPSARLVTQHLWQSEAFGINEPRVGDNALRGSMLFGDCIDDEWLVVWLLLNVS